MDLTRKTIIVVDDVNFQLASIRERLKEHYKVYPAQSVEILFDILGYVRPDLILMDVNMPDVDGFEAVERLYSHKHFTDIPIIILSSNKDRESIIKARDIGAADYMSKPFKDAELIKCIEFHLSPEKQAACKPVILAVDDDPGILQTVSYVLSNRYKVHTLPDPRVIKELLATVSPDLFLLDYNMPGYNGFDLVPLIRSYADHGETPIVFLTTEGTEDVISTAIHLGADGFILKPIDGTLLREKMEALLKTFIIQRRIRKL
jgi:DNA-binding response OmpR family regulator